MEGSMMINTLVHTFCSLLGVRVIDYLMANENDFNYISNSRIVRFNEGSGNALLFCEIDIGYNVNKQNTSQKQ